MGNALAEARRQSGMTITEVSHRTCIRETIIRGIERNDFSACGGDFYARGHIRSIAKAVGVDADPIIADYDRTQGTPRPITAAEVFSPATPIRMRERRRPNWTAALALALIVVGGLFAYNQYSARSAARPGAPSAIRPSTKPTVAAHPVAHHPRRLNIKLVASQTCWVQLTEAATGRLIFSGSVYAGSTMTWTERHAVSMIIGNPAGIRLLVNGRNPIPRGTVSSVTLSLRASVASRH